MQPESEASGAPLGTPGTYAAAARMHNKPNSMEEPQKWEDFELRIFKTNAQPQPITYQDFCNIQTKLMVKTIAFLREVGYEGAAVTRGDGMKLHSNVASSSAATKRNPLTGSNKMSINSPMANSGPGTRRR